MISMAFLPPAKRLFFERVDKSDDECSDKDHHLGKGEKAKPSVGNRPRIEKHSFDVKHDENESVDVEADVILNPRGPDCLDSALVGIELDRVRAAWTDDRGDD